MNRKEYDVVVIGGGPNGLICSAYLTRAGLKVLLLEARHETGGGLDTLEFAGHRYNLHAVYHMMADTMPVYRDFGLKDRGVKYIFPDAQVAYIDKNKKPLVLYRDIQKTAQFISKQFSSDDGKKYEKFMTDSKEFFEKILLPFTYVPPFGALDQLTALEKGKDDVGRRFNEIAELRPTEILDHYGFSDPLKASLFNLFSMWGLSDRDGIGFLFPLYAYRMTNVALCSGGSHRLSSALHKIVVQNGGEILDAAEVVKINLKNGAVASVVLKEGEVIKTRAVASTVDPHQNFLQFFNEKEIPENLVRGAKEWKWEKAVFFGTHVSLKDAPRHIGTEDCEDANNALVTFLGMDDTDTILNHMLEIEDGKLPKIPFGHTTTASIFDPIMAPPGYHTSRFECLVPFDLDWESLKNEYANTCIETWKSYAPNLAPIHVRPYPPTYIEKKFKNMVKGSIKQGSYNVLQMGSNRPNNDCSQTFTPIPGFYVCGASTYPGGLVIGGPGYIGANTIAADFDLKKDWEEPECVKVARANGFIPE